MKYRDQQQLYFQAQFIRIKTEVIYVISICSKHKESVNVIITNNITEKIHQIIVKGKDKFILKSLVHRHMIS